MKRTALIFRYELLHVSETFIKSQAGALKEFAVCYTGVQRAAKSLPIPDESIVIMEPASILGRIERRMFLSAGRAPTFYRRLRDKAPVLIHAHFAPDAAIALPLASELRIPLIVTLHGYDVTSSEEYLKRGNGRFYFQRKKRLFEQATGFLCVSKFIRQKAIEAGFPESKLRVHYTGVDRTFFSPSAKDRQRNLVLFVGRLIEQKGCSYLIEAMSLVQKKCRDATLVLIGDGPARQSFMELAEHLAVSCQFLGTQPPSVIREWLDRAQVFCGPSITGSNGAREGLPTVFMEAQAMGVPVVSFEIGGIPEVVCDGETGLLAREGDTESLAEHLLRYLTDETFWRTCSKRAVEWTREHFDLHEQTRRLEGVYGEVIGTSPQVFRASV
jgi:glycosyltransferase involved in cell wall biosynthesis